MYTHNCCVDGHECKVRLQQMNKSPLIGRQLSITYTRNIIIAESTIYKNYTKAYMYMW